MKSLVPTTPVSLCLNAGAMGRIDAESETLIPTGGFFDVVGALTGGGKGRSHPGTSADDAASGYLIANTLLGKANASHAADLDTYVAHSLRADGFDASEDGTGRGTPLVVAETLRAHPRPGSNSLGAIAFSVKDHGADAGEIAPTLRAGGHDKSHANGGCMPAIAFAGQAGGDRTASGACSLEQSPTLHGSQIMDVLHRMQVRRLTPRECERLQGFPDDYTLIPYHGKKKKPANDGPRYKALGNSMAVPCMRWIGRRIQLVDAIR